ncbi:MAG: hypothetical protein AB7D43_00650 [Sulfurimonadaceae bacterium]|jgi:hypothetical protein
MSGTLTKKEREGLEDVFLSIHANKQKYERLKRISHLLLHQKVSLHLENIFKSAKKGIKQTNFSHLTTFFAKTKKYLRK